MNYKFFLTSSLEKVFPTQCPSSMEKDTRLSAWRGTRASVQLVYHVEDVVDNQKIQQFSIQVDGAPVLAVMRHVRLVPSDFPCYETADDYYITKEPGMFPDLLEPMRESYVRPIPRQYRSVWISWDIPKDCVPGEYVITITASSVGDSDTDALVYENQMKLCVSKAVLPKQTLIHTEWFHTDCLAHYYGVEPFSEAYWNIVEKYISAAGAEHGINMLLTPVFTPPLDTAVGAERLTIQLVDVYRTNGKYSFGFEKLVRWTELCKRYGVDYLEIAHLFTQWGAKATPKIMAVVDGEEKRIFGWDVPATSPEYREFLQVFLPALKTALEDMGYDKEHVYYHISDEPSLDHLDSYCAARAQVEDLLADCQVIDALSNFEFYQKGIVNQPIPANNHIQPFIDANVPDLWVYYCCGQGYMVPNRFLAMKSARNRIMGVLMYLYNIKGFLHWGYNFYNSQLSRYPIDPYFITHANYGFPSGDAYLVYPGPDGMPLSSIRAEVQDEALLDLRTLQLLESLAGREMVESIIYKDIAMYPMTFMEYPREDAYLLKLREQVAAEIEKRISLRRDKDENRNACSYQ